MEENSSGSNHPSFRKGDIASLVGRDFQEVAELLHDIVAGKLNDGQPVEIEDLEVPQGAGTSNETIMFRVRWTDSGGAEHYRGLVLRIAPTAYQLFLDPRMEDQFRLLRKLRELGQVSVPEVLHFEPSDHPFGRPYMLMERLEGSVPITFPPYNAGGFLFDASVADRRKAWEEAVDQMAIINTTPLSEVEFLAETDGDGSFEEGLEWWHRMAEWAKVAHFPAIAELREWLQENAPADPPVGLSWGDARPGNIMFGPDFGVAGVMDWEQLSLGGALLDIGWWLYFDRFHSESLGLERLEGLCTREETISRWEAITGIKVTEIEWYEMLAGYKLAIITARKIQVEKTSQPQNNGNNNIITQQNARMRGIGGPEDVLN